MNTNDPQRNLSRREALVAGSAAFGSLALGGEAFAQQGAMRAEPGLVHILDLALVTEAPVVIPDTPTGTRRVVTVTGGTFEGPGLRGTVLPGGGDWLVARPDGVSQLDVRITMRTDDDQVIYARYPGLIDPNPAAVPTASGPSAVDGRYWRIVPSFETSAGKYEWLNRIVSVGVGSSGGGTVNYSVYAVR